MSDPTHVPAEIERRILILRGQRVILDSVIADLYGVQVKALNQAVRRNLNRFPADFMIELDPAEAKILRSQTVTLRSGHGRHAKYPPLAFTEQGVAMLSSVLRSERAALVNIEIMRAFVRLRQMLAANADLKRKLAQLEQKYDAQFRVVFEAIRELMEPPRPKKRPIGFAAGKDELPVH